MLWIQSRVNYINNLPQILSKTTQQQQAQPSLQHPSKGLDSSKHEHHLVQQYWYSSFPYLGVTNFTAIANLSLVFIAERMLSHISKKELEAITKRIRATTSLLDEPLKQSITHVIVAPTPTDQDEKTTSGLVFKRKRVTTPTAELSHSDDRTPYLVVAHSEGH